MLLLMIETAIFAFVWYDYYIHYIKLSFYHRGNYAVIGSYTLILFLITKLYDGFKLGYLRLMDVLYSQILSLLCSNALMYIQLCIISRDYMNPLRLVQMTGLELVVIITWVLVWSWVYTKIYPPRKLLLVYGGAPPKNLAQKLHSRKDKYRVCEMVSVGKGKETVLERMSGYENVVLCEIPGDMQSAIVEYCFQHSIRVYIIPKVTDIMLLGAEQIHLFDTPILLLRNQGLGVEHMIVKRFMDVVISVLMIMVTSPLMLLIAVCIKVQDGEAVIYRQKRLTQDGKEFNIYKFRSMWADSEKHGARLARKGDSRVTPVGKVIRNLHFDELPQLFNILKGDMSLVGPRPERPEIAAQYQKVVPEFDFRLKVKAGLTGYAQVYGKYNTTPEDKLKLDMFYIEHYTVWMDIKLLLLTFKILFQKENTEGIDNGQVTAVKGEQR